MNNIGIESSRPGWSRPGNVFIIASLTLLGAFLFPLSEKMLDILWVCSFCLAFATTLICVLARSSSDLVGFIPLISGVTLLRMVAQAATARRIIQDEPAGVLLGFAGPILASAWPLGAVLICLLLSVIIIFVVFTSCQRITLASTSYLGQILPLKRMGIETDLRLGVIDEDQADVLDRRVVVESRFFGGMKGTGVLMRSEVAVCIFILMACLVLPSASGSAEHASGTGLLSGTAPSVVALSVFTLIPALIIATSCGNLMSKDTLTLREGDPGDQTAVQTKKITVVDLDADGSEELPVSEWGGSKAPAEQITEFEPKASLPQGRSLPSAVNLSCRNATEYYEKLSRVICTVDGKPRAIILASDRVHSLPVTVPINIAIRLSQKRQKVLLVDTDAERNAVASVFDMEPESLKKKVLSSSLENLAVCCVPGEKLGRFLNNRKILDHFDTTLIYVPKIPEVAAINGREATKPGVFYFTDDENTDAQQGVSGKLAFCNWLCLIPSIQSVLDSKREMRA